MEESKLNLFQSRKKDTDNVKKDQTPKKLLILGNGFDLACGLPSRITDYISYIKKRNNMGSIFKTFSTIEYLLQKNRLAKSTISPYPSIRSIIDNPHNISLIQSQLHRINSSDIDFWDLLFLRKTLKNNDWNQVENEIRIVVIECEEKTVADILSSQIASLEKGSVEYECALILILLAAIQQTYIDAHTKLDDFLMGQLSVFEDNFSTYMKKQYKDNKRYLYSANKLLKDLTSEPYNVVSFNYTKPFDDLASQASNVIRNVHGTISEHNNPSPGKIIFGIDPLGSKNGSREITPNMGAYQFTKTYRDLAQLTYKTINLLDSNITDIIFYGHSLSSADYSYFLSIFDHYHIYENTNISITFGYNPIIKGMSWDQCTRAQFKIVSELLNKYGASLETSHGNNLLHKLILEGRLHINPYPPITRQ